MDLKLIDVPEMGYLTSDYPPRGEICVRTGDNIDGYYKNPQQTAEKFVDGYFRTGDIGVRLAHDKIRIIDRKKNLFKLAQGEFVAPERLEGFFENSSLIEQAYVYGNTRYTNVVAVVVPHADALLRWWEREGLKTHSEEGRYVCVFFCHTCISVHLICFIYLSIFLTIFVSTNTHPFLSDFFIVPQVQCTVLCSLESVISLYITELQTIGKHQGLQGWEIPVAIILEPEHFSAENGLLTATLKKSRPQLEKRYQMQLEQLYRTISTSLGSRCVSVCVHMCMHVYVA